MTNPIQCQRCDTPTTRIYPPATYTHKNGRQAGRIQTYQEAWCPTCQRPFKIPRALGTQPPTPPRPDPTVCGCGGPKSAGGSQCRTCDIKARTIRGPGIAPAWYTRQHQAPGLTRYRRGKMLTRWMKQNRPCTYCQRARATAVDHVIPLTRGGTNYEGNLTPTCLPCNSSKGPLLLTEWKRWLSLQTVFSADGPSASYPAVVFSLSLDVETNSGEES